MHRARSQKQFVNDTKPARCTTKQRDPNIISNLYNNYKRQVYVSIRDEAISTHAESNY